ncbi:MAG: hypothetical protein H6672_08555 [Anaerolineaceae bacterium]|nr:hypothetical protein [Anaerolineaceae bacterium]
MTRSMRYVRYLLFVLMLLIGGAALLAQEDPDSTNGTAETAEDTSYDDCSELNALMSSGKMPYDYAIGGGELTTFNAPINGNLTADDWADYYIFRTTSGGDLTLTVTLSEPLLEVGVFLGINRIGERFQPTRTLEGVLSPIDSFTLPDPGVYTLVIRRPHVTDVDNIGSYEFTARFNGTLAPLGELRPYEDTTSTGTVLQVGGRQQVRFDNGAAIYIPAESAYKITDTFAQQTIALKQTVNRTNIIMPSLAQGSYTGGGMGMRWRGEEGPLLLYIEELDYTRPLSELLTNGLGKFLDTRYTDLESVYILDGCFGFRLRSVGSTGTSFIARLDPDAPTPDAVAPSDGDDRFFINSPNPIKVNNVEIYNAANACQDFLVSVFAPDGAGSTVPHRLCLSWTGIEPGSQVRLENGIFSMTLVGGREVAIQSQRIDMFKRSGGGFDAYNEETYGLVYTLDAHATEGQYIYAPRNPTEADINTPLSIEFLPDVSKRNEKVSITLDWINLQAFRYCVPDLEDSHQCRSVQDDTATENTPTSLIFQFSEDDPIRDFLVRDGAGVNTVSALDDVIHIVYRAGEERLILPADETYIELVTPAGEPIFGGKDFDVNVRPGQPGFVAHQANNMGGDCYPFPTLHPEANCAPNGYPNPANGNLWYSVTDHSAAGSIFDLALTRSYNSGSANVDGPFGMGWSTEFMLDYPVAFDEATGARTVTAETVAEYRVALDLIWAPRGLITYTTPSGSQHVFQREDPENPNDPKPDYFTSVTMPGWVLFRSNLLSGWQLVQTNGMQVSFDRAGRITGYGYPDEARTVSVSYSNALRLEDRINGPGGFGEDRFIRVTDKSSQREIELYYDNHDHIYRSVLRDMTRTPDYRLACDLEDNCHETLYRYDEQNRLTRVIYPNRTIADYAYNADNLLESHDDPRAPLAQRMSYTYDDTGRLTTATLDDSGEKWLQEVRYEEVRNGVLKTTIKDMADAETVYTYTITSGDWNSNTAGYRLDSIAGPQGLTRSYDWTNGGGSYKFAIGTVTFSESSENGNPQRRVINYTFVRENSGRIQHFVLASIATSIANGNLSYFKVNNSRGVPQITNSSQTLYNYPSFIQYDDGTELSIRYALSGDSIFISRISENGRVSNNRVIYRADYRISRYGDSGRENWVQQVNRQQRIGENLLNDLVTYYDYNSVGLVTYFHNRGGESSEPYIVRLAYDGFGQVTVIQDGDDEANLYRIQNKVLNCANTANTPTPVCREVTVTDPFDAVTIYRYDAREQLIEVRLQEGSNGDLLRHTRYTYDELGRLTGEISFLNEGDCAVIELVNSSDDSAASSDDDVVANCGLKAGEDYLLTQYAYSASDSVYIITRTDAEGRKRIQEYDAQGRLTRTVDETGHETTYEYSGRTVTQTEHYGESQAIEINYTFDSAQRLDKVTYQPNQTYTLSWDFSADSAGIQPNKVTLGTNAEFNWHWDRPYLAGMDSTSTGGFSSNEAPADFTVQQTGVGDLIRLQMAGGSGNTSSDTSTQVTRCWGDNASYRLIYHRHGGASDLPVSCDQAIRDVDAIYEYDAHDRLLSVTDEFGTRTFTYALDTITEYRWRVTMTATSLDGDQTATWVMIYNFAGDLMQWTDDHNVTLTYTYDLLGRLIEVITENDETSQQFTYNDIHQVIRIEDRLGRITEYTYDPMGWLIEVVTENNETTTYAYNEYGMVESVTHSQNGTEVDRFTYQYDEDNPTLLTGVTTPDDRQHTFAWDSNRRLTYTDPRTNTTSYQFNALGQLIATTDATGAKYQWGYDQRGYLASFGPNQTLPAPNQLQSFPTLETSNLIQMLSTGKIKINNNDDYRVIWRRTLERTPNGLITAFENSGQLGFSYDLLGRLESIDSSAQSGSLQYTWVISQEAGSSEMTLSLPSASYVLRFDALNRIRSIVSGDTELDYRYVTPRGNGNVTPRIEVRRNGELEEIYRTTPDGWIFEGMGEERHYTLNQHGQVEQLEQIRCTPQSQGEPGCSGAADRVSLVTMYDYDAAGNVKQMTYPDGTVESFVYDDANNLTTYTLQQAGQSEPHEYRYEYDEANRLIMLTTPEGSGLQYFYANDHVTAICYLAAGMPSYDNLNGCTDEGATLEQYEYDALGRMTSRTFDSYAPPDTDNIADYRKALENVIGRQIDDRNSTYSYNLFGQLIGFGTSATLTYTEDGLNLPATYSTGAGGETYTFHYESNPNLDINRLMLLTRIESGEPYAKYVYTYDESGRVASVAVGAGDSAHTFTYDYRPDGVVITDQSQSVLTITIPYPEDNYSATPPPSSNTTSVDERKFANDISVTVEYHYARTDNMPPDPGGLPLIAQTIRGIPQPAEPLKDWNTEDILTDIHRYYFDYDEAGNLIHTIYVGWKSKQEIEGDLRDVVDLVPEVCATYVYDGANRLVAVHNGAEDTPVVQTFAYDTYDRLIRAGERSFVYLNEARTPSFVYDSEGNGAVIDPKAPSWNFEGGRWVAPGDTSLVDADIVDPCRLGLAEETPVFETGDVLFNGMVVDAATGIAFIDGRAYLPTIGRFLQRDPLGPDANGAVYGYPSRAVAIPMPEARLNVDTGLRVLAEAVAQFPAQHTPTMETIRQENLPHLALTNDGLNAAVNSQFQTADTIWYRYLNLPDWLSEHYNQPGPQTDPATGLLSWDTMAIPGQYDGRWSDTFGLETTFWNHELALNTPIEAPNTTLTQLLGQTAPGYRLPTLSSTQSGYVRDTRFMGVGDWPSVTMDDANTPQAALDTLLGTRIQPWENTDVLDITDAMTNGYTQTGLDWVQQILGGYLPDMPTLSLPVSQYTPGFSARMPGMYP